MLFAKTPELAKRFIGSRKRRAGEQVAGGLCLATLIALFYVILVFAPPATSEFSIQVVAAVKENQFYIFTHKGILRFVEHRHQDITQMRNPSVDQGL